MRRKIFSKENENFLLLGLGKGVYFGDEEGFDEQIKGYSAKVASRNAQILIIPKNVNFIF